MSVRLALAVQYGVAMAELPRWRLRRWIQHAIEAVAPGLDPAMQCMALTLRLVDAREGRRLNREFRERDYATNVLTFEYGLGPDGTLSGDIVLCIPVLRREAREQKKNLLHHAAHLTIHGVLHALGHDHIDPDEALEMEALEARILRKMGISNPYEPQNS
ncbi:rRNA maturation RNase YbeY [Paralcaligenes sp. KSB-10]|jgi:probable rRNA maturation factor|uniref:rRNA maturation RNase YbeY n=1 Tax=Paralcaligenes sp. KSB-10 TaxID=2901142 RepID=UPI001E4682E5|nr:rRNA maturation RNase YbeY [Paralcaligenes sp. KSB-10]UHL62591.1 rRNA maturation RNase YbeY [Paralcaligenes sp. KSB-10]